MLDALAAASGAATAEVLGSILETASEKLRTETTASVADQSLHDDNDGEELIVEEGEGETAEEEDDDCLLTAGDQGLDDLLDGSSEIPIDE
jgi:putative sterol carrier protein